MITGSTVYIACKAIVFAIYNSRHIVMGGHYNTDKVLWITTFLEAVNVFMPCSFGPSSIYHNVYLRAGPVRLCNSIGAASPELGYHILAEADHRQSEGEFG